jgi:hypothetical protein
MRKGGRAGSAILALSDEAQGPIRRHCSSLSVARLLNRRAGKLLYAPPRRTPIYYRHVLDGCAESGGVYSLAVFQESGT